MVFYGPSYLAVTCSVFARGVQDYGLFWENSSGYAIFSASWLNSGYMSTSVYVVVVLAGGDAPRAVFLCVMPMKGKHIINYLQYHEYGFGRPSLEREVQWDFRVHSSSCGAHRVVVHSPFEWLYHRCHCYCRDLVLFVGRLPWLCVPDVLRGCLRCDVVWW